jgi:hypothetical protein
VRVGHGHHHGARQRGQVVQMLAAHHAHADDAISQHARFVTPHRSSVPVPLNRSQNKVTKYQNSDSRLGKVSG